MLLLLRKNAPRRISALQSEIPHIYVDASVDASAYSGLGGVVISMSGEQLSFFSTEVGKKVLDAMMLAGQGTIIQELEMMAVLGTLNTISQSRLGTIHRQRGRSGVLPQEHGQPMKTMKTVIV